MIFSCVFLLHPSIPYLRFSWSLEYFTFIYISSTEDKRTALPLRILGSNCPRSSRASKENLFRNIRFAVYLAFHHCFYCKNLLPSIQHLTLRFFFFLEKNACCIILPRTRVPIDLSLKAAEGRKTEDEEEGE